MQTLNSKLFVVLESNEPNTIRHDEGIPMAYKILFEQTFRLYQQDYVAHR